MIAVDFFCGGGGLTRGLLNTGIDVLGGIDNCPEYKETYEKNNSCKFVRMDIQDVTKDIFLQEFPEIVGNESNLLLTGCAPCQPFSSQRREKTRHQDTNLLLEFGRLVDLIKPAYIFVENVPGLEKKGKEVLDAFLQVLQENRYLYSYRVVNAKNYGVPQNRSRLVIIASRTFQPHIPEGKFGKNGVPFRTVREAIEDYPPIEAGEIHEAVPNHEASPLSDLNIRRIKATPHSGGNRLDWPPDLVLECHRKGHTGHTDVYGRMDWDKEAPTLTSKCFSLSNGRYGHPDQDRAISLREAAALQSFDDGYVFFGNKTSIGRQIGNAVPVKMAEVLANYILHNAANAQLKEK